MLVVRVQSHPDAFLASAGGGVFHGGYVATLAEDDDPLPPAAPPTAGGADDLDVGCGRTIDEAIEDLAMWLSHLARHTTPDARDRDPLSRAIRAAQLVDRPTLVASLHERVQELPLEDRRRVPRAA